MKARTAAVAAAVAMLAILRALLGELSATGGWRCIAEEIWSPSGPGLVLLVCCAPGPRVSMAGR